MVPKTNKLNDELLEYHQQLVTHAIISADANNSLPDREFYSIASSLLSDAGVIDDVSEAGSFHHYNKHYGTKIDGWGWNELEKTVYGIITEFNEDSEEIKKINKAQLEKIGQRVARLFESVDKPSFLEKLSYDAQARLDEISECIEKTTKFRVVILTNHELSVRVRNTGIGLDKINNKDTTIEVWDLPKIMELELGGVDSAPIEIDFEELFDEGLKALSADFPGVPNKSYLCVLPGEYLSQLYHEFGQRLLQSNVRSFLNFGLGANKGMRMALLTEPEKFFAYNNGITVTATSHKTKTIGKQLYITELENMQIVNGGQTTGAIYFAPKDPGGVKASEGRTLKWSDIDLRKVFVQMKLTIIEDKEEAPEITQKISRYSNTQTTVKADDLISNEPLHLRIEQLSRRIFAQPQDGNPTKWFYERSRGQYNVFLRRQKTPSMKKTFMNEYPKNQMFKKTDLMKYENTWRMNPNDVVKGPTWNTKKLNKELAKEFDADDDQFREAFYHDLIAKAILFKDLDRAVGSWLRQEGETGHKAETITYTVACLRHLILKQNKEINLKKIYHNQSLSDELLTEALKLAIIIRHILMNEDFRGGIANVTTFCKKRECWHQIRELDTSTSINSIRTFQSSESIFDLEIPDEDLLNKQQQKDQGYEDKVLGQAGAYVGSTERILQVSEDQWKALIEYLKDDEGLPYDHKKVNLIRYCVYHHRGTKIPTVKQAKAALEIRDWAMNRDFSFIED